MKSASEFYRDSTRIYDLTKEYHELSKKVEELEDILIGGLPADSPLLENETLRNVYLRNTMKESDPDLLDRWYDIWAEITAMRNEQQAVIAAGWAASYELTSGTLVRQ